jgi:Tfp pilus assembly protein PilN
MQLDVNLAQKGASGLPWRQALWAAAVVLVAGVTAVQGWYYASLRTATAPDETRIQELERKLKQAEAETARLQGAAPRAAVAALPKRVEAYNKIITAATFSWTQLLLELEAALPPEVGLTAIQPDPATGTVNLRGVAKSLGDMMLFVHQLEQRADFREVFLLRHAEAQRQGGQAAPRQEFDLKLVYRAEEA